MPSQQEVKWSQLKVGIIVLVSVCLLSSLLFLMSSASGMDLFSKKLTITTYFQNSEGLKIGAPVNLEGVTIGEVKKVEISTEASRKLTPVKVIMKLDPKFSHSLHKDSTAALSTVGVLGDTVIDINSQTAVGPPLQDGDEMKTLDAPNLTDVIKSSEGTVESLNVILAKIDRIVDTIQNGQGSVGMLIKDPTLYQNATRAVGDLQSIADDVKSGKGSAGLLLHDDQLYNNLKDTTAQLDLIAKGLHDGKGPAGMLLNDETVAKQLKETIGHADSLLAEADSGQGGLGVMMKDKAFAKNLSDTMANLDTLLTGVNAGQGSLGALVKERTTVDNLNKVLVSTNDLVTTIRSDPKKYLTIHMKIF